MDAIKYEYDELTNLRCSIPPSYSKLQYLLHVAACGSNVKSKDLTFG